MRVIRCLVVMSILAGTALFAQTQAEAPQTPAQDMSRSQRMQAMQQRRDKMMQEMKANLDQMRSMLEKMRADAQKVKDQSAKSALLQNADMWQAMLDHMQQNMDRMDAGMMGRRPPRNRIRKTAPDQGGMPEPTNPTPPQ